MKPLERLIDQRLRTIVELGNIEFGFRRGRSRPSSRIRFLPVQAPQLWTHHAVVALILLLILLTIKGNYKPNLLVFLLQIINVLPMIISEK